MRVLVVDPRIAGISGDMVLSALVDMVGVWEQLYRLADTIENTLSYCSSFRVEVVDTVRRGVRAKMLKMSIEEDVCNVRAIDLRKYVEEVGVKMRLSSGGISYALNVIDELIEAEARIHGVSRGEVVFHELASSDTVFDIVGVSLMLD
ncbi:MAG: nickel insertion protein, partial [Candidatus Methanomethylicia archaeon]